MPYRRLLLVPLLLAGCTPDDSDVSADATQRASVVDEALLCEASDFTWSSPSAVNEACSGPWEYRLNHSCNYSGADCDAKPVSQRTCVLYPMCKNWDTPVNVTSPWRKTYVDFEHMLGTGSPLPKAEKLCQYEAKYYYDHGLGVPTREPSYEKTLKFISKVVVPSPGGDGPGLPKPVHRYTYECKYRVKYLIQSETRSSSCAGCDVWQCTGYHDSCPNPCSGLFCWGETHPARYTNDGLSKNQFSSVIAAQGDTPKLRGAPTCTTCDNIPLTSLSEKITCLQNRFTSMRFLAAGGGWYPAQPEMRPRVAMLARFVKVLTELRGHEFTEAQRAATRALYGDEFLLELEAGGVPGESPVPACGVNREVAETCTGATTVDTKLEGTLDYCTRVTGEHVAKQMRTGEYADVCLPAFEFLASQMDATGCELPAHVDDAVQTLDRYTAQGRRTLREELDAYASAAMTDTERATAIVSSMAEYLGHMRGWSDAIALFVPADDVEARIAEQVAAYWSVVQGPVYMTSTYTTVGDAILEAATEDLAVEGLALDQLTLRAAYADTDPPPLTGASLIAVTGQALASLVDRLDTLGEFADLGCALRDCHGRGEITPLAWLWQLVANIDDPAAVASLAYASPTPLAGWRATFLAIAPRLGRLTTALETIVTPGETPPPEAIVLVEEMARAQARTAAYLADGTFGVPAGDELRTPLHSGARDTILNIVTNLTSELDSKLDAFDDDVRDAVLAIVELEGNAANVAIIETRREAKMLEAEELATRLQGHIDALAIDPNSGLQDAVNLAVSATGTTPVLELVSLREDLQLSAQNAEYSDGDVTDVTQIAASTVTLVDAGHVLAVSTSGVYAPSCAVREMTIVDDSDDTDILGNRVDMSQALTGPQGYTIGTVAQAFDGHTNTTSGTHKFTVGTKLEVCGGFSASKKLGDVVGLSFSAQLCGYTSYDYTRTKGWSDSDGTNTQTSIGFTSGLFLANTPMPFAPAGALVIVEMPRGVTDPAQVRDFHLVQTPLATIPVTEDSDFYLVINDKYCPGQDGLNRLTVQLKQLASADVLGQAFLTSVGAAVSTISEAEPSIITQGELLPSVAAELRADARQAALAAMPVPIAVSDYPPALREVYERFESRAIARLDHRVRANNLDRELVINDLALRTIDTELEHANRRGYLLDSLPRWSLRSLRSDHLRMRGLTLGRAIRDFVRPVLQLWDPALAQSLRNNPHALSLSRLSVDSRMVDAVAKVGLLSEALADGIVAMSLDWRENGQPVVTRPVIIDIPNTAITPTGCGFFNECPTPPFTRVSDSLSLVLWNALRDQLGLALLDDSGSEDLFAQAESFTIQLSPDQLYRASGGTGVLECTDELPVIRHIGLGFRSDDPQATDTNGLGRWVTVTIGGTQPFVLAGGERSFTVLDAGMLRVTDVPVFFAEPEQIEAEFYKKLHPSGGETSAARIIGLSPFAKLTIELPAAAASWGIADASSLYLVLDVERVPTYDAARVGGAPSSCPLP